MTAPTSAVSSANRPSWQDLLKEVKSNGLSPAELLPLADAATESLTVDPGLGSADKLISFAMSLKDIDLHNTKFVTLPWRYEGSRVAMVQPDAEALWAALKANARSTARTRASRARAPPRPPPPPPRPPPPCPATASKSPSTTAPP
ncbi:LytR family transcriptional regulator OS=Streptomyces alboniger OX=132473 GN=CP975_13880 PE=3 SV=1 [Streptomyces alboniger]